MTFFSLLPLVTASIVNEDYKSEEDVYDAILNTLFPVFFVILFNCSGKTGPIKSVLLPLLDDLLHNTVTWVIPLIVSFAYDDLLKLKIFSIVNMGLHLSCAASAIIMHSKILTMPFMFFLFINLFTILFSSIFIPTFWIVVLTTGDFFDPINMVFLTLFGILSATALNALILGCLNECGSLKGLGQILDWKLVNILLPPTLFYLPNILQTLLIVLKWPIDFYFVKACVFILVLSLTRNASFFMEQEPVPNDFLATSTTSAQCQLRNYINSLMNKSHEHLTDKKRVLEDEIIKKMQDSMAELKESMAEMKQSMTEMKNNMKV